MKNIFIPKNENNSITKAISVRDTLSNKFKNLIENWSEKNTNTKVILRQSQIYDEKIWLSVHYAGNDTDNEISMPSHIVIEINRHDFHRYENTFTITTTKGDKVKVYNDIYQLDESELSQLHQCAIQPTKKYKPTYKLRKVWYQFWRPRNKNKRVRSNRITQSLFIVLIFSIIYVSSKVGIEDTIDIIIYYPKYLLSYPEIIFQWFEISMIWLCAIALLILRFFKRPAYILTTGKPSFNPRSLLWLDSWQTNVIGLGDKVNDVGKTIFDKLSNHRAMSAEVETIGHWGADDWVERKQIVIQHQRAIAFISVQKYDDDLYVAWEVHLNRAAWTEEKVCKGIDKITKKKVQVNQVAFGYQDLTEFDISDGNFLSEYIHESIKKIIKLKMGEYKIDQEIDFSITRESRREALNTNSPTSKKSKSSFKRKS